MSSGTSQQFRRVLRYLWDSEPGNTDHSNEIVCLGVHYNPKFRPATSEHSDEDTEDSLAWPPDFLDDVESRMWLTYRTGFPLIPRAKDGPSAIRISGFLRGAGLDSTGFTSDVGWGCMIRTAQSLLANSLLHLYLGRDWRISMASDTSTNEEVEILLSFRDDPSAPYSLHNFVTHGEEVCGKRPGEWFGPSAAASSIKHLCLMHASPFLRVYTSNGSDIYEDQLRKTASDEQGLFQPTLVLLGLRLGIDCVNPIYWDTLRVFLGCKQAVGIAGGRPSASHYFYAYQGDNLFYLDPHKPQPSLKTGEGGVLESDSIKTVHCRRIRTLHLSEMDPSMLVGFLIRDANDWADWKATVTQPSCKSIVTICAREPLIRRSSVSVGFDDAGYVDVALEHDDELEEDPIMVDNEGSQAEDLSNDDSGADNLDQDDDCYGTPVMVSSEVNQEDEDTPAQASTYSTTTADEEWEEMPTY